MYTYIIHTVTAAYVHDTLLRVTSLNISIPPAHPHPDLCFDPEVATSSHQRWVNTVFPS